MRIKNITRKLAIAIINTFFCGNHFWRIKRGLMRLAGADIGKNTKIVGPLYCSSRLSIGENCWIGLGFSAYGNGSVKIGNDCDLAPEVSFVTGSHEIGGHERRAGKGMAMSIEIGNGCWIGTRATILGNTVIKDGCVVGSCAIVNKSFEEDSLIVGVPGVCKRKL